ncbi:MAG: hypothetical protein MJ154_03365 [Candidatus Saccharibacteria bacterium]|nr:hypothetical protein [Candidatus Saccharibacteria bacterium]
MKANTVSIEYIGELDSKTITNDLRSAKYSIIESFGFHQMKKEMSKIGTACRLVLWYSEKTAKKKGNRGHNLRKAMSRLLDWGAPSKVRGFFPHVRTGFVFGFNHPTLGEILRLVSICFTEYPDRKYLFPVNIAWYEELAPVAERLEAFGLYITPIVTPSAKEKLSEGLGEESMHIIDNLARKFNNDYLALCDAFIANNDIVMVAPTAGRQSTVFKSYAHYLAKEKIEPATMTLVAMSLIRLGNFNFHFIPLAILPPKRHSPGLNLFKVYTILPGIWISPSSVRELCKKKNKITNQRAFEHYFLHAIADDMLRLGGRKMVYPLNNSKE